jgi:hypothetical protein
VREQIGALRGASMSAFPDGRLTELLRLDCGGYIVSEITSAVQTAPFVIPKMRHRLPKIGSPFGCAAALRPKATTGCVPAVLLHVRQHPAPSVRQAAVIGQSSRINVTEAAWTLGVARRASQ